MSRYHLKLGNDETSDNCFQRLKVAGLRAQEMARRWIVLGYLLEPNLPEMLFIQDKKKLFRLNFFDTGDDTLNLILTKISDIDVEVKNGVLANWLLIGFRFEFGYEQLPTFVHSDKNSTLEPVSRRISKNTDASNSFELPLTLSAGVVKSEVDVDEHVSTSDDTVIDNFSNISTLNLKGLFE